MLSAHAMQAFAFPYNGLVHPASIGRSSRACFYFWANCGVHLVFHSARYVHEDSWAALNCRRCSPPQPLSSHEEYAWNMLQASLSTQYVWLPEAPVAGYKMRPADIWLPFTAGMSNCLDLVVQIDGEQHFTTPMYGISIAQQQARDARFNDACWAQGLRVLRLHHSDKHEWPQLLQNAIWSALQRPQVKFRWFSSSFARQDVEARRY